MELSLFDHVADAVRSLVDPGLGDLRVQPRRWGIKVWFGALECPRAHYEAQVINAGYVPAAEVLAVEVGFHAEHPKPADNLAALAPLVRAEASWRRELGDAAVAGDFLGRSGWQRLSETWPDPDLGDPELCFDLADRLAAYVSVIEPLRA